MTYAPDHSVLSWHEFETLVIKSVIAALDPDLWRIKPQHGNVYRIYGKKRVDLHVAERRQGGRGYVIDAKHYTSGGLPKHEVDSTLEYKYMCRASRAILIASNAREISERVADYAYEQGVILLPANRNLKSNIARIFEQFRDNDQLSDLIEELGDTGELELSDEISDSDLEDLNYDLNDQEKEEKIEDLTS